MTASKPIPVHARFLIRTMCAVVVLSIITCSSSTTVAQDADFESMFNGKNMLGWHISENPGSFKIEDGCMVTDGDRAHAFYVGPTGSADYTDFHLKAKVKTEPGANSGIYFHTKFQESGWPTMGYEAQVNNTQSDPKKTGGLYAVVDNFEAPVVDKQWFDYEVIVQGKRVQILINGETITDYVQPEKVERPENLKGRLLGSGTIAIQAHDPGSKVYYKDLMIKRLK